MHLLTVDAVKWSLGELTGRRIHEWFLPYLQLHRRAQLDSGEIDPRWLELEPLLEMPGGPPNKPNYRPFHSRSSKGGASFWFQKNLAGSYAPSSMRSSVRYFHDGTQFRLPVDHVDWARKHLLFDHPVSAYAMGGYFLRNFGFAPSEGQPSAADVVVGLRQWFELSDDGMFDTLFDASVPEVDFEWFAPSDTQEEQ